MGLLVSHGAWSGPYSTFHRFRTEIARVVGIPLPIMDGFHGDISEVCSEATSGSYMRNLGTFLPMRWESLVPDALHVLLNHSDCDGEIAVSDLLPLAVRLEEIADKLGSDPIHCWPESARMFASACRMAHAAGEPLVFS